MSKKVLIISTSLRNQSNSETLAHAFAEGAEAAGNVVEQITLRDKQIAFCKGCLACQKLHSVSFLTTLPPLQRKCSRQM